MICLICNQAGVYDGVTSVMFERRESSFIVRNVPARICPSCGEAYVEEKVAEQLLNGAEMMSLEGMDKISIEYASIA